jgi:hypothetical protein
LRVCGCEEVRVVYWECERREGAHGTQGEVEGEVERGAVGGWEDGKRE